MQFSVWPMPERSPGEVLERARDADAADWLGIWYADHYMPNTGTSERAAGDVHEAWAMVAAITAVTTRLRVGTLVSPTTVHHPALLANRAATIDRLGDGRFVLGIGAGWQVNEHDAYGIDLMAPKQRVDRFEEAIQIVRSLLDTDRTTFIGDHFSISDAPCEPCPVQQPLPILVGTAGHRMLRITARHAQEWNTWAAPELAARRRREFEQACADTGVDPASLHTSVQALVTVSKDRDVVARIAGSSRASRHVAGSPAQVVDALGQLADLGFDEFILPDITLGDDESARREGFEAFRTEIAAQVP
jgi:alkanesulfonate monooxygenase SsuD/methylene tetrahydromethanopterin reductase-like flavin-dependent oxidoreductase (luciferase family)